MGLLSTLLVLLQLSLGTVYAQVGPYRIQEGGVANTVSLGGVAFGLGERASARTTLLLAADLVDLNEEGVQPAWDRIAVRQGSRPYAGLSAWVSNVASYGSVFGPAALYIDADVRRSGGEVAALFGQATVLNAGITNLIKNTVARRRPYVRSGEQPEAFRLQRDGQRSFFSGHTSNAATNAFLAAAVYRDFHPQDRRGRTVVWASAITLPLITGIARVMAGVHYPSDVIVGYLVGAGIGLLVPELHRRF